MIALLAQLFWTFFLIGMFTFGGGYAMLSLIQAEVVVNHAWLSESTFTDIVAISQMTPGPIGINCATYVGYDVVTATGAGHLMGIVGSLTATLAITLPSFFIVLLLVKFYTRVKGSPAFEGVMSVIRPAVVGLIGAAAIILIFSVDWNGAAPTLHVVEENFPDWRSWLLFAAAFLASFKYKVNPILLIVLSGVMGLLLY
jgi:chromate transporter